jgi:hypothetical protein
VVMLLRWDGESCQVVLIDVTGGSV